MIRYIIIAIQILYAAAAGGWVIMQEKCLARTTCLQNPGCQAQIQHCSEGCSTYIHRKDYYECLVDCMDSDFSGSKIQETEEFMDCMGKIIELIEVKKNQQTNQFDVIRRKRLYEEDKYAHTGETFKIINCKKYMDHPELKKKVIIKQGAKQKMIFKYFQSRCDFFIQTLEESSPDDTSFYLKWTDYVQQQNYTIFKAGQQLVNHIPNSRYLLSDKNKFVITLENFDASKENPYKVRSHQIHFKTYVFRIDESSYTPLEQEFFNQVNQGYWLAKDPYGSLGKGIKLFRNITEIKEKIKFYKENRQELLNQLQVKENRPNISMFQVIQKYLDNPFLIHGRKFDIRSYVLIASVNPFVVLYQSGFIKKCISEYDLNFVEFDEEEAMKHLTNRSFQKKNQNYTQEAEDLMMSIDQYENYLKNQKNFTPEQIKFLWSKGKKTVSYSILSAKKQLAKKRGYFQLLGIDLIYDDQMNAYIIEYNTSAGLFMDLSTHHLVIPQLLQSTLDLMLDSHRSNVDLYKFWSHPEKIDLGKWEILYNQATGYDFLLEFEKIEEQTQNDLFSCDHNNKNKKTDL